MTSITRGEGLYVVGKEYVGARVIESLIDLLLSITLWREGYTRNSAGKAFSAVKALMSALIVVNEDKLVKLAKDEERREWIEKKAHTVPTHSMYSLAQMLKKVGVDIVDLVDRALNLHDYQYNGSEPGFSRYTNKEDVLTDLIAVITETKKAVHTYLPDYEVKELSEKVDKLLEELANDHTSLA